MRPSPNLTTFALAPAGAADVCCSGSWGAAIVARVPGIWRDLDLGAPVIARLGMDRINAARVALLGTLRPDASPRISPVEPYLAEGQLLVGAMAWSKKAADLLRDPRFVLHSAVTGPDSGEGELKLYGSAVEAGPDLRGALPNAWWSAWPADWLPSLGQAGRGARLLPLSVTAFCRTRALLSSARLARGRLAGIRGRC
jgi:hypothetical protein